MLYKANIFDEIADSCKNHAHHVERLLKQRPFFEQIHALVSDFHESGKPGILDMLDAPDDDAEPESVFNLSAATGYMGPDVTLTLSEGQTINMVKPLLSALVRTRLFHPATYHEGSGHVTWQFYTKDQHNDHGYSHQRLVRVIVVYAESQHCRRVETGKMVPEYEVRCDDGVIHDKPSDETKTLSEGDE